MLVQVENVAAVPKDEIRQGGDDARAIRTADAQDGVAHGTVLLPLSRSLKARRTGRVSCRVNLNPAAYAAGSPGLDGSARADAKKMILRADEQGAVGRGGRSQRTLLERIARQPLELLVRAHDNSGALLALEV